MHQLTNHKLYSRFLMTWCGNDKPSTLFTGPGIVCFFLIPWGGKTALHSTSTTQANIIMVFSTWYWSSGWKHEALQKARESNILKTWIYANRSCFWHVFNYNFQNDPCISTSLTFHIYLSAFYCMMSYPSCGLLIYIDKYLLPFHN